MLIQYLCAFASWILPPPAHRHGALLKGQLQRQVIDSVCKEHHHSLFCKWLRMERAMLHNIRKPGHEQSRLQGSVLLCACQTWAAILSTRKERCKSTCLNTIYILFQRSWGACSFSWALPPKEGRDYTLMQDLGIKVLGLKQSRKTSLFNNMARCLP